MTRVLPALVGEDPAVGSRPVGLDVLLEQLHEVRRYRYFADGPVVPLLESSAIVYLAAVGVSPASRRPGLGEGEEAPPGFGQIAVIPAECDSLGRPEAGVIILAI